MKTLADYGRLGQALPFQAIDVHGHLGRFGFAIPGADNDYLVGEMDRVGVGRILMSHTRCMSANTEYGNRVVAETMEALPGRVLGYLSAWPSDRETVAAAADRWLAHGFVGIKIHNATGFSYTIPDYEPLFERANERRLLVLLHTWAADRDFSDARKLAARWPGANFILAHAGCERVDEYIKVAREFPNVFLDTTLSRSPFGLIELMAGGAGAEKILWGSDSYFLSMSQQVGKVLGSRIPDDDKRKILRDNAARLLAMVRPG
jgi:predicted TIM-barrel fold metal-dependent hydrolase